MEDTWVQFTTKRRESVVCLLDFQIFKDKSLAINCETGLSDKLTKMIRSHHSNGQKIAVGKSDYKTIIESRLKIHCLFNEPVKELMWSLKHIMKSLVLDEPCELTTEDRCHNSQGMKSILSKYGFELEPEKVDEELVTIANGLYQSEYHTNSYAHYLHRRGEYLKEQSGIDCKDWDLQKLAAALKLLCYPNDEIKTGTSDEMLSEELKNQLVNEAHKYEDLLHKKSCLNIYKEIMFARSVKNEVLESLKAKGACATQ